jgi:hypothetical protein
MSTSEWQPIETAPENEYILIRYYKGGKSYGTKVTKEYIVTQAKAKPIYEHSEPLNINNIFNFRRYLTTSPEPWNAEHITVKTDFVEWVDGLHRLITNTSSKVQKNYVTHWMPLPEPPEEMNELV